MHYEHKELGYNYRLSNLLAAVGRAQLKKIDYFVSKRRDIFKLYYSELSNIPGFNFMPEGKQNLMNRWLTALTIDKEKAGFANNELMELLEEKNIESRPVWKPMHLQPLYKKNKFITFKDKDESKNIYNNGICLPSGSSLTIENQQNYRYN